MDILSKHKKKGLQGFREFIYYLEQAEAKRLTEIVPMAWLEDPVYAQYLEVNLANFNYFSTKLSSLDYEKIFKALPNGPATFTLALKKSSERDELVKGLPPLIQRRYLEIEEITLEVTTAQRHEARNCLIRKMRELQDRLEISAFPWKLPSEKVLKGEHFVIPSNGRFLLIYENGTHALEGGYEKKLRSGIWSHFHPNGKLLAKGPYSENEKIGAWSFYNLEGKLVAEGHYSENLRAGDWKIIDEKGVEKSVRYERGRIIG